MSDANIQVTAASTTSVIDQSQLLPFERILLQEQESFRPVGPVEVLKRLKTTGAARRYLNFVRTLGPSFFKQLGLMQDSPTSLWGTEEARWYPAIVEISSAAKKKSKDDQGRPIAGERGMYNSRTRTPIPTDTKFFPLHMFDTNTFFGKPKIGSMDKPRPVCKSLDGANGLQSIAQPGGYAHAAHVCGSASCPAGVYTYKDHKTGATHQEKKPEHRQSLDRENNCSIDQVIWAIDSNLTNIYAFSSRQYGLDGFLRPLMNTVKSKTPGLAFDPTIPGAPWFQIRPETPKGKNNVVLTDHLYFQSFNTFEPVAQTVLTETAPDGSQDEQAAGHDLVFVIRQVQFLALAYWQVANKEWLDRANAVSRPVSASVKSTESVIAEMTTVEGDFESTDHHTI